MARRVVGLRMDLLVKRRPELRALVLRLRVELNWFLSVLKGVAGRATWRELKRAIFAIEDLNIAEAIASCEYETAER